MRRDLGELIGRAVAGIEERDPELAVELRRLRGAGPEFACERFSAELESLGHSEFQLAREAVVLETGRPVLTIVNGRPILQFSDPESEVWRNRLQEADARLAPAIAAVGRIEVEGLPDFSWVGTGALVWDDVVVTNQHVAHYFAERLDGKPVIRLNDGGDEMLPSIDFLEEEGRNASQSFSIVEVLHLEDDKEPDIALLRVEPADGRELPPPLKLFSGSITKGQQVAAIGYPAFDSRTRHIELIEKLFGQVYDKKRLSPGQIMDPREDLVVHDCSVLNGNSGSAVVDLATGHMVGLHFTGEFGKANYAVPASVVREHLRRLGRYGEQEDVVEREAAHAAPAAESRRFTSVTVPIHITVTVQPPVADGFPHATGGR